MQKVEYGINKTSINRTFASSNLGRSIADEPAGLVLLKDMTGDEEGQPLAAGRVHRKMKSYREKANNEEIGWADSGDDDEPEAEKFRTYHDKPYTSHHRPARVSAMDITNFRREFKNKIKQKDGVFNHGSQDISVFEDEDEDIQEKDKRF
jgi:hypothetical protein